MSYPLNNNNQFDQESNLNYLGYVPSEDDFSTLAAALEALAISVKNDCNEITADLTVINRDIKKVRKEMSFYLKSFVVSSIFSGIVLYYNFQSKSAR